MSKPIIPIITTTESTPADIIVGNPKSTGPSVRFGPCKAHPDGKRSALTVLGDLLVKIGFISPGAH